ncbi:hypothetical protein COO60DRAFT_1535047 [Scenedesmus sp. NREL 46B-D3]|nr:hypothetical protein COO60DRAFT_1535047 [Scenedesmus sp. NREL 46B-D3]
MESAAPGLQASAAVLTPSQAIPQPAAAVAPVALQQLSPAGAAAATGAATPAGATEAGDEATPLIPFAQCGGAAGSCKVEEDACGDAAWEGFQCPDSHPCQRWDPNYWQCLPADALANLSPAPATNASRLAGANSSGASATPASNTSANEYMLAELDEVASASDNSSNSNGSVARSARCGPGETAVGMLCVQPTNAASGCDSGFGMRWGLAVLASMASAAALMLC